MVSVNSLKECPVQLEHITNTLHAFGPLIAGLEGKAARRASTQVQVAGISVSDNFYRLLRYVTLTADVMFINWVFF